MRDDVTWRIPGMLLPSGLKRGKEEILGFLRWAATTFPAGFQTEVKGVYGDGGNVVLELVNRSTAANGRPYENEYCFVFEVEGGRIRAVREYVDTQKVDAIVNR
jgi:ketosteroid isomerase-like protein